MPAQSPSSFIHSCGNCGQSLARPDIEPSTPPFPHLLKGKQYAEGAQISAVRDTITTSRANITTLDDEIYRLETTLTELRRKRASINLHVEAHQGLLSPIRQIPSDLLGEIFMHFSAGWGGKAMCSTSNGPLAITGICRHWRNFALNTPLLWSCIPIVMDSRVNLIYLESMLTTWLLRAKSSPLSITVRGEGMWKHLVDLKGYPGKRIMDTLTKSSLQWQNLHLELTPILPKRLAPITNHLPILQKLSLSGQPGHNPLTLFQTAPQLSSLIYVGHSHEHRDIVQHLNPFKWEQIIHFDCQNDLTISQCRHILSLTREIKTAIIHVDRRGDTLKPASSRSIDLAKLRRLSIFYDPHCDLSPLLDVLCTPMLTSFEIAIDDGFKFVDGSDCTPALSSFLSQAPALHIFTLGTKLSRASQSTKASDTSILLDLLQNTPELKELNLHWLDRETLNAAFFDALVAPNDTDVNLAITFLPALASISIFDNQGPEIDMAALINATRSRATRGLRELLIYRTLSYSLIQLRGGRSQSSALRLTNTRIVRQLRELRDQGVNVSVFGQNANHLDCNPEDCDFLCDFLLT